MARLEDYELGRVLASGGMGVVHEAVERASGRRVALKRILPHALEPDAVARFVLEGRAVARLTHPGIVQVHALGEAPDGPFLVMDLVAGDSLQRALDRAGPLAVERALAITRELALALAHAHERGVLHRDLKPANVLVDAAGSARLIDFGLAKLLIGAGSLAHLTRSGELLGTPAFMAPEQASSGVTDARTDVYGLGATLFALLTAQAPFTGASTISVLHAVLTRPATPPSRLRPGLAAAVDALVLACLQKDPAARPPSMAAVLARVDALDGDGAGSRTHAGRLLGIGALLAVAAGAAAVWHARPQPRREPPASALPAPADQVVEPAPEPAGVERPGDPDAWLERARARARKNDIDGALAPPDALAPPAAWLAHGRALLAAERATDAVAALAHGSLDGTAREVVLARFQAAVARAPATADVTDLTAELERAPPWPEGIFERELHRLQTAPDTRLLRDGLSTLADLGAERLVARLGAAAARASEQTEDRAAALSEVDRVVGDPPDVLVLLERAELRLLNGDDEGARTDLDTLLRLDPLLARGHLLRAKARMMGSFDLEGAAADWLRRAALLGSSRGAADALLNAARLHLLDEDPERALAEAEAAHAFWPSARADMIRGQALHHLGRDAEALAACERVLDGVAPATLVDYEGASFLMKKIGLPRPDWGARFLTRLGRENAPASEWLEAARDARQHPTLAETATSEAVARGGGAEARRLRAQLRETRGDLAGALEDLRAAHDQQPADSLARRIGELEARLAELRAKSP